MGIQQRIMAGLGKIPGVPTRRGLGRLLVTRGLAKRRGDADFLGFVRDQDGWHLVPSNYETEGDKEWGVPTDGSDRYRADGIGGDWGTLYGVPVVVGYRDFGAARQLPNTQVARDVIVPGGAVQDEGEDVDVDRPDDESGGLLPGFTIPNPAGDWRLSRGLKWIRGDADALDLVQDSDGQWALERVEYRLEDQMYRSRDSDSPYDAEGAGCAPKPLAGVPLGFSNGRFPSMLPPVRCRLGRNTVEGRLAGEYVPQFDEDGNVKIDKHGEPMFTQEVDSWGGATKDASGRPVLADGGVPESAPEPTEVTPGWNDIELEERAFVNPDDIKQLGDPETTQEKIEAMIERVKASQNTPGGDLGAKALQYGGYFLALILGWWFGQQSAGGGGGEGGGASVSPVMVNAKAHVADAAMQAPTVALEAGVGVI